MFNPPITDGVQLFLWIVVGLLAFAKALTVVDIKKTFQKKGH